MSLTKFLMMYFRRCAHMATADKAAISRRRLELEIVFRVFCETTLERRST